MEPVADEVLFESLRTAGVAVVVDVPAFASLIRAVLHHDVATAEGIVAAADLTAGVLHHDDAAEARLALQAVLHAQLLLADDFLAGVALVQHPLAVAAGLVRRMMRAGCSRLPSRISCHMRAEPSRQASDG